MALKKTELSPEEKKLKAEIAEERRRVERELVFNPREILGFLNNSLLGATHRQGWKPIKPERLQVLTRCAGILIEEMRQLADDKILLKEEAIIIWVSAALYLECIDIQKRVDLPFGHFSLRG